jgi:hypothetical protein
MTFFGYFGHFLMAAILNGGHFSHFLGKIVIFCAILGCLE